VIRLGDVAIAGAFALAVALVLGSAAWEAVRVLLERAGKVHRPSSRARIVYRRVVMSAGAFGTACLLYGRLVEPFWPEVTRTVVTLPRLAPVGRPVRLVHLTDLHCDPRPRLEERLPDLVAAERPDLVVFTGDAVNEGAGVPVFRRCMERIARVAPTFAVRGNWDAGFGRRFDLFGGTGVRELDGESVKFEAGGAALWIAGVAFGNEAGVARAFDGVPPGACTVFLYHTPDLVYDLADRRVDLVCAGHTHGGQVALPLYGALITLSRFGKRFESGMFEVNGTHMYVGRGIGMDGGLAPRVRFCARPEIAVIDLLPGVR